MSHQDLPDGYQLSSLPPTPAEYCWLREVSGLTPIPLEQAEIAVPAGWAFQCVRHQGQAVAMGRIVGDGAWYLVVTDMATHPDHQRRGLGRAVLTGLLNEIRSRITGRRYVTLTADPPGKKLYASLGFRDVAESGGAGMTMWL